MYYMKWVRLFFAYLFCVILLISLINVAFSTSEHVALTNQTKIENWIIQSRFYPNLQKTIIKQAKAAIPNDVSGGSSISSSIIENAGQTAFTQEVFQHAVHEFVSSNYAWLQGNTSTPNFKIDLSTSKLAFADKIAQIAVEDHLKSLSACTASQSAQLQTANPLLLSCKPSNLDPVTAASQIKIEIANNNSYLSNPVITANTISAKGSNGGELYYIKFSKAPKVYQTVNKLPLVLGVVSLLSMLLVLFISRTRRIGIKRIGIVLLLSGLLLVSDKFVSDALFNRYKDQAFNGLNNGLIQSSATNFVHYIESELVKIDLWFGLAYIAIAVFILVIIFSTRNKESAGKKVKKSEATSSRTVRQSQKNQHLPKTNAPNIDHESQPVKPVSTPHIPKANYKPTKQRKTPRPPKLIQ